MSSAEDLRHVQAQMGRWGITVIRELEGGELVYAESQNGRGLAIELITRDGYITFLSLGEYYWADYSPSGEHQAEVVKIIECVMGGGAVLVRGRRGCRLICGKRLVEYETGETSVRAWDSWCEPAFVEVTVSLPIRC